ncbi:MAG: ATP-dependent helicase [Lachnospiraceae bacterium]|nr:ATP-dependent helicase [Lachnospiraceae bacterium]
MEWNKEQERAIRHKEGPALVLAGPGSGKTAVITAHVKALEESGIKGNQILVLTFTRAAAREMEERFRSLTGDRETGVTFGTFHSLCFHILKEQCGYTGQDLMTEREKRRRMKETLFRTGLLKTDAERQIDRLLAALEKRKAGVLKERGEEGNAHWEEEREEETERILFFYQEAQKRERRLDFEDILLECRRVLGEEPVRRYWQKKWRYLLIDEYQDLNRVQAEIARLLAGDAANLFVVGDEDQAIYGFRGAEANGMRLFSENYPSAKLYRLTVNYRSVPEVTEAAARLIRQNKNRFPKKIQAFRFSGGSKAVKVSCFEDEKQEVEAILNEIRAWRKEGIAWEDMAVLYRSGFSAGNLAECLTDCGIPFHCQEPAEEKREDWVRKDMQAYWNLAETFAAGKRWRRRDLLRVLNRPERELPRAGLETEWVDPEAWIACFVGVEEYERAARELAGLIRRISRMDFYGAVSYVWKGAGYRDYARETAGKQGISWHTVLDRWEALRTGKERKTEVSGVRLMTMHAAKGLEFSAVFLPGLNEGEIPHGKPTEEEVVEEERRLMYVAVTRAKDRLCLSWTRKRYGHRPPPSRFLLEMQKNNRTAV